MDEYIALVTVLYNSNEVLDDFVKSLSIQNYKKYHLFVVDNSPSESTDLLLQKLFDIYPQVKYTHLKQQMNVGIAKGNNIGIKAGIDSGAEYILLLNNDVEFVDEFVLYNMINSAKEKKCFIVVPKILFYGTRTIWMAGGCFQHLLARTPHVGIGKDDNQKFSVDGFFDYAPTCFMLISVDVFAKIGMMDEQYFVYYDDSDFILRAMRNSYRIYYNPLIEIYHKVSVSTGGGMSLFSVYYTSRNRLFYIRKNFSCRHFSMLYVLSLLCVRCVFLKKELRTAMFKGIKDGLFQKIV